MRGQLRTKREYTEAAVMVWGSPRSARSLLRCSAIAVNSMLSSCLMRLMAWFSGSLRTLLVRPEGFNIIRDSSTRALIFRARLAARALLSLTEGALLFAEANTTGRVRLAVLALLYSIAGASLFAEPSLARRVPLGVWAGLCAEGRVFLEMCLISEACLCLLLERRSTLPEGRTTTEGRIILEGHSLSSNDRGSPSSSSLSSSNGPDGSSSLLRASSLDSTFSSLGMTSSVDSTFSSIGMNRESLS